MTVYRPPTQGSAYTSSSGDNIFVVEYRLGPQDSAVCPHGRSLNQRHCLRGPGVIRYTRTPGACKLEILEGCTKTQFTRMMP